MKTSVMFLAAAAMLCGHSSAEEERAKPRLPDTKQELKAWLEGTNWCTVERNRQSCFFRGKTFETPLAKPSFTVLSRRALIMNWGKGIKVTCVITEDCKTMSEVDGAKVLYSFEGKRSPDKGQAQTSPKVETSRQ